MKQGVPMESNHGIVYIDLCPYDAWFQRAVLQTMQSADSQQVMQMVISPVWMMQDKAEGSAEAATPHHGCDAPTGPNMSVCVCVCACVVTSMSNVTHDP